MSKKNRNYVAKNMVKVCRHRVFRDRKNSYKRKPKHFKKFGDWAFLYTAYVDLLEFKYASSSRFKTRC